MTPSANTLWAGLYCPALPLTAVWQLAPGAGPVAVHEQVRGQARILQVSRVAHQGGIRAGQSLTNALAILPQLHSRPRNRRAETGALEQLALIAYAHSDQVVIAPPDTLLLEVGRSRRLHGSLATLLDDLCDQVRQQGFGVRCGLAPIAAAARLLARLDQRISHIQALHRYLAGLPIQALELPSDTLQSLLGCGFTRTGELSRLPAAERTRRFGKTLNDYLDQIHGRQPTPLAGWQPAERFALRLELPLATTASQALMFVFRRALDQLGQWLDVRDQGLTRMTVGLEREDGGSPTRFELSLARPGFDRDRLLELVGLKLDQLRLPAAIDAVAVKADSTDQHRPPQADLFNGHNRNDVWPALLDRLGARLGKDGIASLAPRPDHRPEKSWAWVAPGTTSPCQETRPRPSWLLPAPRPCHREQMTLEEGPERIESGWWDGQDCRRDYWIARDRHGRRLWIFHEHKPREGWFIHGLFG